MNELNCEPMIKFSALFGGMGKNSLFIFYSASIIKRSI